MYDHPRQPLAGMRVLDLSRIFSVPYAGGLMTDLGAEVIKIEAPHLLDSTRGGVMHLDNDPKDKPWNRTGNFHVLNRAKRSLVLDLSKPEGQDVFKKLVAISDFVIENYTPRVMRNFGLHYEELAKINPKIIMLSNCGYGATGPYGQFPIQGTALEGTMGIVYYSGYADVGPSKIGQSYPDFTACWSAMMGVFAALHHMRKTGRGQHIDDGMYQIGVALVPEPILAYQVDGTDWGRIGNRDRANAPSGVYPAEGTDRWLALTVDSDAKWQRLLEIMGRSDLIGDPRFDSLVARHENHDEIDRVIGEWTSHNDAGEMMKHLQSEGITAAAVLDARDLMYDEHLLERRFYEVVDFGEEGGRPLIGRPYKMRNTPLHIKRRGPEFGDANMYVLKDLLDLDDSAIQKLYEDGIVRDDPANPPTPGAGGGARPAKIDEQYREKLAKAYGYTLPETEAIGTEVK